MRNPSKYPGYRTMTAAQRYNARMDRIWEQVKDVKTSFNANACCNAAPNEMTAATQNQSTLPKLGECPYCAARYTDGSAVKCPHGHIDNKGFVYCAAHGTERRSWHPSRQMRAWELARLQAGKTIAWERYSQARFIQRYGA